MSSTTKLDQHLSQRATIKRPTGKSYKIDTNQKPCAMKPQKQKLKKRAGTGVDESNNNQNVNDRGMLHNVIPLEKLGTEMTESKNDGHALQF